MGKIGYYSIRDFVQLGLNIAKVDPKVETVFHFPIKLPSNWNFSTASTNSIMLFDFCEMIKKIFGSALPWHCMRLAMHDC